MRTRTALLVAALAAAIALTGCAPTTVAESAPTTAPSATSSATATTSPSATPAASPVPLPAGSSQPAPALEPVVDPNVVDPANYVSHAIDTVNGGALSGVEFMSADGEIVCGIVGPGVSSAQGMAACTPSTWQSIVPQVYPDTGPYIHGVSMIPFQSPTYLYPDLFSQPARTIPVLPDGKRISYEGMTCEAIGATIECRDEQSGHKFVVSTAAITMF